MRRPRDVQQRRARQMGVHGALSQAQSRAVRKQESMPGTRPKACLAPLPCTLLRTHHVVFGQINMCCDQLVMAHRLIRRRPQAARGGCPRRTRRNSARPRTLCPSLRSERLPIIPATKMHLHSVVHRSCGLEGVSKVRDGAGSAMGHEYGVGRDDRCRPREA